MAHHGTNPNNFDGFKGDFADIANPENLMQRFQRPPALPNLGATGEFPNGKITDDDEGEIRIGITEKDGIVVLDFGKSVNWIGFTKEQAKQIGQSLIDKASK